MNKRFMSLLLVLVMVFSLLPFGASAEGTQGVYAVFGEGAYAQPARATYKFVAHGAPYQFNNEKGESTDQQILINGDSLYDVGEPMPNAHETFDGWYVGDQKVEFGTPMTVTANGEVEVVARFTEMQTVTFYADAAGTVVLTVKEVAKNADLAIDGLKAPAAAATSNFAYWTNGTNQYAADGTVQNVTADVELKPVFATGAWLSFSANGGSYNAPQFFENGNVASGTKLPVPTRAGYAFAGWYDESTQVANASGNVTSAISIPADGKTLTAQWTANNNVAYKVAYWQQNANPDENGEFGYSLAEKPVTKYGTAGEDASYDPRTYEGFSLNPTATNNARTTIKGDGTTIRNVYFDRNEYTIRFYHYQSSWSGGSWIEYTNLRITAKYGQNVSDKWPSRISPEYPTSWIIGTEYSSQGTSYATSLATMPLGDQYYYYNNDTKSWTMNENYYLDPIGTGAPRFSDIYSVSIDFSQGTWRVAGTDSVPGFTYDNNSRENVSVIDKNGNTANVDFHAIGDYYEEDYGNKIYTANFHFIRNSYPLAFNENGGASVADHTVQFEEDLQQYNPSGYTIDVTTKEVDGVTYIFKGWYDNAAFVGNPFNFNSTMPASGISLYAKWEQEQYRIDIDPNGGVLSGTEATFTWKKAGETIDRYDDVTRNYVEDANGTFYYNYHSYGKVSVKDSEDSAPADRVAQYVTDSAARYADSTKYAYEKDAYSLIGWYIESADGTRTVCPATFEVTGPTKLVAEWRRNGEFTVVYDGGEHGTVTAQDSKSYVDQAETVAAVAPTAAEGWVFTGWLLNGETYVPGDSFVVDAALANASKEITLVAQYRPADAEGTVPTAAIVWHANNGTDASVTDETALNKDVAIRAADTFKYDGYIFLGWAKTADAGEDALFLKAVDNGFEAKNGSNWQATSFVATNSTTENNDLYAVWDQIDNHNYVIDFNGKMTIATSATAKKDDSHNNGAFDVAGGNATYQLDYQLSNTETESSTYRADLAFNGIDTAMINGVPVGSAAGTTASWEKYTVIPANNVYFDDSLVGKSMTAGDGSGYNVKVKDYESSPENGQEKTSLVFTFYGTGIDVYCTTDKDAGWIQANVDGTAYPFVNSRYQESEGSTTAIYNTPVISIDGLAPNVEHTLTLRTLTNSNFRLDGIRVYNAMQGVGDEATQAAVNKAYDAADESNAVFLEVRDRILAAGVFSNGAADTDVGDITGAVFLETKAEGATIADYTAKGPKEEAYLAPGQAIAFNLGGWTENTYKVMVGLSMPKSTDSGTATVYASGHGTSNPIKVSARTDMFYEITPDASGNVIIKNNGGGMISVTKLKITTIDPNGTAYEVPAQTTGEPAAEGARGLRVTKSLMAYAMAFDPATEVSPTDNVEEPDTPEEPDDPKPGWNDGAFNPMSILKNLFQNLLDGLGKLFGNLPKW